MKEKIDSWIERIDLISASFESEFRNLSVSELNWKPREQIWSIAQVMEHLININASYLPVIANAESDNYKPSFTSKIPGFPALAAKSILKAVHPDNKRKTKTFAVWQPSRGFVSGDIIKRFLSYQVLLKQRIINAAPLLHKSIIISSPTNKYIVYTLENAFEIIVLHEERHLRQALEMKELLKKTLA